jgi:hypothetical protein
MKSEYRKMQAERQKEIKLAEEQKNQAEEKRQRDLAELKVKEKKRTTFLFCEYSLILPFITKTKSTAEEGDRIRKLDAEYRAEQERLGRENNTKSKILQQELINMIKQAEDKRQSDKNHIAMEEEKAEHWKSRKLKQWKMRKEVEKNWFE